MECQVPHSVLLGSNVTDFCLLVGADSKHSKQGVSNEKNRDSQRVGSFVPDRLWFDNDRGRPAPPLLSSWQHL
jgi:hypothetical protein